ncbi:AAA family ATPase [Aquariibacter albus]|uniref:AAA family ATPase n=1 Tax=Aquariibacter albus TaxID=2759899 RepID=A0A839HPG0_9BURK|nr:AAA family ATPase [Aquariibacter albus]MBB1161478.1 AAA family ATPase [Aquariibacter albus]
MSAVLDRPTLLELLPDGIPLALRQHRRWAPWRAVWAPRRGKWDKVPCAPAGYGLSTAKPERWLTFDEALAAVQSRPDLFAGLGYLMTGAHGVVGLDLDRCIEPDGALSPWAAELVAESASYAERSPSGHGVRVMLQGAVPADWTNHERGIEVYGGHEPRFLTLTGHRLEGTAEDLQAAPAGVLEALAQRHARERTSAEVVRLIEPLPDLVDELLLPELGDLSIPWQARAFLSEGEAGADRSRTLFATTVALFAAGLPADEVLSLLATNPHAMGVALDHRRQDADRALMYLWVEHTLKARGRARRVATAEDFDDVTEGQDARAEVPGAAQAGVSAMAGAAGKPAPALRFKIAQAAAFTQRAPLTWLVKRVLPLAEVGAVFGESGSGKSFLVLDLALAIATGREWRGHRVRQGRVLYIAAEGSGGMVRRLQALAEHHGLDLAELAIDVLGDAPNFLEKQDIGDLLKAIEACGRYDLVVVDTLAQVTPGANENAGEDMGRALAHCKVLHQRTRAMVLLVAHAGKDTSRGLRGWSGIKGALDVEIMVERSDAYRAATVTKMKDGEGEGTEYPFTLQSVTLGQDEDGEAITSCVVQHGQHVPQEARKAQPKGSWQTVVLRTAKALCDLAEEVTTGELIEASINEVPKDEKASKDRRRERILDAIQSLVGGNLLSTSGGKVVVL